MQFEFDRTASRLYEMQSTEYLAAARRTEERRAADSNPADALDPAAILPQPLE